jgi:hypothetical protein
MPLNAIRVGKKEKGIYAVPPSGTPAVTAGRGKSVQRGFAEITLRERGKERRIKNIHISERSVQKRLCDNAAGSAPEPPPSMTTARPSRARAWRFT